MRGGGAAGVGRKDLARGHALGHQLLAPAKFIIDRRLELFVGHGAANRAAVDEEVRRALHTELLAQVRVVIHALLGGWRVDVLLELLDVETDFLGVLLKIRALEILLVGEELVVHLPELALRLGRHSGLGRKRRIRVKGQGGVPEEVANLVRVVLDELVQGGQDAAAEGALEVGEGDDGDLRLARSPGLALEGHALALDVIPRNGCARGRTSELGESRTPPDVPGSTRL
jgi:hypothetical protein